ncbi:helix-turn-helix domain-containing protein [Paenibacillus sp. WQ 127069]|uniref:Helix-turn-helix domain-containing protein n=1 Tax=Paenibacillus baimaensis TaxID=2982185 RepID=A0ABT2UNT8_9BACL|nr:helix-turn-helix domain-containing protein [Paenibacillus sp. WQ 127069]MCU6796300.1 helix-turn-helix domain-containing protein [Paenibacillus sp. WQ 127069]
MKIRQPKFLVKLFIFSALSGTLPVLLLGLFSYNKSSDIIQDKVAKGNQLNLEQTQQRVEQILKTADKSVTQFIAAPLANSAINKPLTPEHFDTVNGLLQGLQQLQSFELGIHDIMLVSLNRGWALNNSTEVLSLEGLPQKELLRSYAQNIRTSFWKQTAGGLLIHLVKKLPLHTLNPSGLIVVEFNGKELSKLLASNQELGEAMILDEDYNVLAHTDPSKIGSSMRSMEELQPIQAPKASPVGLYYSSAGTSDVGITYRRSSYNGWMYVSVSAVNVITRDSKAIAWYTFTACLLILMVTLILSWLASKKMYNPIGRLVRSLQAEPELPKQVETDEIQFIGSHVQGILHDKQRLSGIIEGQRQQLEEFFMIKLLQGEVRTRDICEKLEGFGYDKAWERICVAAIQIDTIEGTRFEEIDEDLLLFAINNIVTEIIPQPLRLPPMVIGRTQVTLLGCPAQTDAAAFRKTVDELAAEIGQMVERFLEIKVSLGISRFYSSMINAHNAYLDATEALKYTIRTGHRSVIYIEDVEPEGTILSLIPDKLEQELLDAVKLADFERADALLAEFLHSIFQEKLSHREYFVPLTGLLLDLMRMAQSSGESIEVMYGGEKSLIDQLYKLKSVLEIEQWFRQSLMNPLMQRLEGKRKHQYARISDQMLAIIHQEAETDLNLEICASRLGYHPDYIRGVFRKETGVNFSDYLSNYRLQKARVLLVETGLKISEIAERLQYNNSQNFIRYFRKQEGMTPGQFREKHIKGE